MASKFTNIALYQASFVVFTGIVAVTSPTLFWNLYGLGPIAKTPEAHIIAPVFGARNLGFALSIIIFHQRQSYANMTVPMLCLAIAGTMDTIVTYNQNQYAAAAFHAGGSLLLIFSSLKIL